MLVDILILVGGLALIVLGANYLTDGAVVIARKFKISELLIGLTIIAVGTSTPELVVSVVSSLKGNGDMAVGNVLGSNIFNSLAIIGVVALIKPIRLTKENAYKNIPIGLFATLLLVIMASSVFGVGFMPKVITKWEGILLLLGYIFFTYYTVKISRKKSVQKSKLGADIKEEVLESVPRSTKDYLAVPMIIGGLVALVYGGDIFLESAVSIAKGLGVSEYIISITLMAGGTSLPELASCVVAARRGRSQMALGNVIGSNITNILLCLGASAAVNPLPIAGVTPVDLLLVTVASLLLLITPFSFKKAQIDRVEAAILLAVYIGYIIYIV